MRAFLRILLFVIVGPPIGTLAMMLTSGALTLLRSGRIDELSFGFTQLFESPMLFEFGYVLGGVPALVAGIVASVLPRFMTIGWAYRGWVTLSGAVASMIGTFAFVGPSVIGTTSWSEFGNFASFMLTMAWIGTVAAFSCVLFFDGLSHTMVRTRVPA